MTRVNWRPPVRRDEWYLQAACRETNDPRFVPNSERDEPAALKLLGPMYCWRCPVKASCLGDALRNNDHGIRADTTTQQRRTLLRVRDRVKCPLCGGTERVSLGVHDICVSCGSSWRTERATRRKDKR